MNLVQYVAIPRKLLTPLVVAGSFHQSLHSAGATWIALWTGFMKLSASEFACGRRGVIHECFIPLSSMYTLIFSLANGGQLSFFATLRIPCVAKILSVFVIVERAAVEYTIST